MNSKELFEKRYVEIVEAKKYGFSDYPFGMSYEDGQVWLAAQQSMLLWVLEMLD